MLSGVQYGPLEGACNISARVALREGKTPIMSREQGEGNPARRRVQCKGRSEGSCLDARPAGSLSRRL